VCNKKAKKPFKQRVLFLDVEIERKIIKILKPQLIYSNFPLEDMGKEHFLIFDVYISNKKTTYIFILYGAANSERVTISIKDNDNDS